MQRIVYGARRKQKSLHIQITWNYMKTQKGSSIPIYSNKWSIKTDLPCTDWNAQTKCIKSSQKHKTVLSQAFLSTNTYLWRLIWSLFKTTNYLHHTNKQALFQFPFLVKWFKNKTYKFNFFMKKKRNRIKCSNNKTQTFWNIK